MKIPIVISNRQKDNPMIELLKGIPCNWIEDDCADYIVGSDIGVLFLSLKFHRQYPRYLEERVKKFQGNFKSRVLLTLVDVEDPDLAISKLTRTAQGSYMTLVLAFKYDEVARWLISMYNTQDAISDELKASNETPFETGVNCLHALGLSRREAEELLTTYGSIYKCLTTSKEEIMKTTSLSAKKVDMIYEAIRSQF
ncbi:DNA repair protein rad10 containing protein [Trichomonas vaginalis G3]|uniref:DNA repair protein rad10 containing protein n=1 Tax=Trichomonas vaginalis (strain ATCC PRA-98 / G3) TaxID=412133 RepID=A2DBF5_TRIV3|nr:meiotic mismatch repair [Trichomonas vaginalis G3]EAY22158.1 DNA repair protein rad10 containing protein [Trichomonas vaginalis G3]KAI5533394.1 meiotic mismatch repair [Trichomonas vaginalis G3]|eukprot:XP_001583144.1 DNA repair protein rad10 containing protein [Trichomonas vaginalis G3]